MKALFGSLFGRRWTNVSLIIMGLLAAFLPAGAASAQRGAPLGAQQGPPNSTARYSARFQVVDAPAQFDLVQIGADFAPGATTPQYAYGGPAYNTVMAGEITVNANGAGKTFKAGETWSDQAGQAHTVSNNGQDHAVVYTSVLLSQGAGLTGGQGGSGQSLPSGPKSLFLTRFPAGNAPSPLDLVQVEVDQQPGSWTSVHTHPGAAYNTVIRSQLLVRAEGKDTVYGPGQSWVNPTGQVHAVQDASPAPSAAFTTFLVPRDAAQVSRTVADPPPTTLPVSGSRALPPAYMWLAVFLLAALVVGTTLFSLRRRSRGA